jgi:hypothetical protein
VYPPPPPPPPLSTSRQNLLWVNEAAVHTRSVELPSLPTTALADVAAGRYDVARAALVPPPQQRRLQRPGRRAMAVDASPPQRGTAGLRRHAQAAATDTAGVPLTPSTEVGAGDQERDAGWRGLVDMRREAALVLYRFWPHVLFHTWMNEVISTLMAWRRAAAYAAETPGWEDFPAPAPGAGWPVFLDDHPTAAFSYVWRDMGWGDGTTQGPHTWPQGRPQCFPHAMVGTGDFDVHLTPAISRYTPRDVAAVREYMHRHAVWGFNLTAANAARAARRSAAAAAARPLAAVTLRTHHRRILNFANLTAAVEAAGWDVRVVMVNSSDHAAMVQQVRACTRLC